MTVTLYPRLPDLPRSTTFDLHWAEHAPSIEPFTIARTLATMMDEDGVLTPPVHDQAHPKLKGWRYVPVGPLLFLTPSIVGRRGAWLHSLIVMVRDGDTITPCLWPLFCRTAPGKTLYDTLQEAFYPQQAQAYATLLSQAPLPAMFLDEIHTRPVMPWILPSLIDAPGGPKNLAANGTLATLTRAAWGWAGGEPVRHMNTTISARTFGSSGAWTWNDRLKPPTVRIRLQWVYFPNSPTALMVEKASLALSHLLVQPDLVGDAALWLGTDRDIVLDTNVPSTGITNHQRLADRRFDARLDAWHATTTPKDL